MFEAIKIHFIRVTSRTCRHFKLLYMFLIWKYWHDNTEMKCESEYWTQHDASMANTLTIRLEMTNESHFDWTTKIHTLLINIYRTKKKYNIKSFIYSFSFPVDDLYFFFVVDHSFTGHLSNWIVVRYVCVCVWKPTSNLWSVQNGSWKKFLYI